jgi:hypothetical protein
MKLILLSDLHLSTEKPRGRLDDFEQAQWAKLEHVMQRGVKSRASIVQAGDFCDRPRNWQLLFELMMFFKRWSLPRIFMVRGQHDMYMHSPEAVTTITALKWFEHVEIMEGRGLGIGTDQPHNPVWMTGIRYGEDHHSIPPPEKNQHPHILVVHAPIAESPVFERHDYIDARGFAEKNRSYDIILCGDIHRHFCIKTKWNTILNTGPMMRREATEHNFKHEPCFYWFDTDTGKLEREIIPHRNSEEILTREHLEEQKEIKVLLDDFVNSIRKTLSSESPGVDVMANLERALKSTDIPQSTKKLIQEVVDAASKSERK